MYNDVFVQTIFNFAISWYIDIHDIRTQETHYEVGEVYKDNGTMQLKGAVENAVDNDILVLLSSYLILCEDGDEVIEALYEFAGNCKGFVAVDEEMTQQVTKTEFEAVLDECEAKCGLKSCIENNHVLNLAEVNAFNLYRDFGLKFKNDAINLFLPRIEINTDVEKYISEELGTILYDVLKTKLTPEHIQQEMNRYIPETRLSAKSVRQLFKLYFYDVVLYRDRKPRIYIQVDEEVKRVIVLEFFKRIIGQYLRE